MAVVEFLTGLAGIGALGLGLIQFYFSRRDRSEDHSRVLQSQLVGVQQAHTKEAIHELKTMVALLVERMSGYEKKLNETTVVTEKLGVKIEHLHEGMEKLEATLRRSWDDARIGSSDNYLVPDHRKKKP